MKVIQCQKPKILETEQGLNFDLCRCTVNRPPSRHIVFGRQVNLVSYTYGGPCLVHPKNKKNFKISCRIES